MMYTHEEIEKVRQLGNEIGYGNVMWTASREWGNDLKRKWGGDGGQFAVGPCVKFTVPCGCESPKDCDWCCGSGWLTERAKEAKDALSKAARTSDPKIVQDIADAIDCKSEEGVTSGLIDAIMTIARVLAVRNLSGNGAISEALSDLRSDRDLKSILHDSGSER